MIPNKSEAVDKLHNRSDLDSGNSAQHHTLGWNAGQAASGIDVKKLIDDLTARIEALEP